MQSRVHTPRFADPFRKTLGANKSHRPTSARCLWPRSTTTYIQVDYLNTLFISEDFYFLGILCKKQAALKYYINGIFYYRYLLGLNHRPRLFFE